MVNLTTFMVAVTAMMLGVYTLDESTANKIKAELKKANIIPEAVDDFEPLTRLKIRYDEHFDVQNGELLTPEQTLVVPSIYFDAPSNDSEYTLAMVNLDTNGPLVRHWIATNVKGGDELAFLSQAPTHEYTSYRGPTPPPGPNPHRIAFVLFEQQDTNQTFYPDVDSTSLSNRDFFDLKQFAQDNHLTPISAAYFYTEHQDGLSQNYPPVSEDGMMKEAGLVDDIGDVVDDVLGDVGDAVDDASDDLDDLVDDVDDDVDDIKDDLEDGDYDDIIDYDVAKTKARTNLHRPTGSSTTAASAQPTEKPKKGGLVNDVLEIVDDVLRDIGLDIEIGHGHNDKEGDSVVHVADIGAQERQEMKQAGLIDDLLGDLDDALDIDIGVGHHHDRHRDDDGDGDSGIVIELVDGYPVNRAVVSESSTDIESVVDEYVDILESLGDFWGSVGAGVGAIESSSSEIVSSSSSSIIN